MIPKIIHYCWFGKKQLPNLAQKCIRSWKKYCSEYKIIEWNEDNFDINSNNYVRQAYEEKKYAFVTDYVRLYVLYNYGGIYMDTDVEVLKPLDDFLNNQAFSGFETSTSIPTGIMGGVKGQQLFMELLTYYNFNNFINEDGTYDMTTNVTTITNYCKDKGLKLDNTLQTLEGFTIYPQKYFCPKDHLTGKIYIQDKTYTIHHFAGSWLSRKDRVKNNIIRLLGQTITQYIVKCKKKLKCK